MDISSLVNNWTSVGKMQTTTSLTLSSTTFQHGQPIAIGIGVNPSVATGNVAITNDLSARGMFGSNSQISLPLSNGQAAGNWVGFPGGTYDVYANYGGDANYGGGVSAATQITVAPEDSVLQLAVAVGGRQRQLDQPGGKDGHIRDICFDRCAADREVTGFAAEPIEECNRDGDFYGLECAGSAG